MLESKLSGIAFHSEVVRTMLRESEIAHHLEAIQEMYPVVKVGSYPQMEATDHRVKIVLRSRVLDSLREAKKTLLERIGA